MRGVGRAALFLVAGAGAAGVRHPAFRYERPVLPASSAASETCVALPLELLPHAAPQLEDLRVMAGDREVAYQLRISSDVAEQVGRPEQILNLGKRNGAISFDVEMTEPRYSRVLLKMARSHFSVLVHVTGIDRPGEAGVAFPEIAYSSDTPEDEPQMKLIMLPESDFRYLHFEIQTLALEPVTPQDIAGVDVLAERAEPPRYVQAAVASGAQQKPHETIYEFAVPANVPLDRLSFTSDDPKAVFSTVTSELKIEVVPDKAGVFVDGAFAGNAHEFGGVGRAMVLKPGTHTIKIACPGFQDFDQTVDLAPGKKLKIKETLTAGQSSLDAVPNSPEGTAPGTH